MMSRKKYQGGFSLVELMVTVAIAGILLAVGVPSFRTIMQTNKVAAQSRSVVTAFNFARSEAVTRKTTVNVVPSDGNSWSNGITVWTDADGSGAMNNNDDEVLQVYQALEESTLVASLGANARITFDRDGFMSFPVEAISFDLQLDNCHVDGRTITLNLTGRVAVETSACP